MMITGEDPGDKEVDHKDRVRDNNAWHNLQLVTRGENAINREIVDNSPYPLYVIYNKYHNIFVVRKKGVHESRHKTLEEAIEVASTLYITSP